MCTDVNLISDPEVHGGPHMWHTHTQEAVFTTHRDQKKTQVYMYITSSFMHNKINVDESALKLAPQWSKA
jgi:hypothetical protein